METCKKERKRTGLLYVLAVALAAGSLMLGGCDDENGGFVMSLQPSYTAADLEVDKELEGSWATEEGNVTFRFEQGDGKQYRVAVKETQGGRESSAEFEAHFMRLGTFWFVDFFPNGSAAGGEFYQMHLFRVHSMARIELSQDAMQMTFLDGTWLQKKVEEKSVDVSYQKAEGELLLTGTTEEVQNLLFLHGNDSEAFPAPILLSRQEIEQ
ncbi:MAG TPA: hypothetical protein VJN92_20290 [Candidatus Acidoferrum sp.]|nr:hypothetical protein [Candidatus Acidoferrum sp.]